MITKLKDQITDSLKLKNDFDIQRSEMEENLDDLHAISEKAKDAIKNVTRMYEEAEKTNRTLNSNFNFNINIIQYMVSEYFENSFKICNIMYKQCYHSIRFIEFHQNVQTSRAEAEQALKKIPEIKQTIQEAERSTNNIKDALRAAEKNAMDASKVAQEAHHKYAKQASEVIVDHCCYMQLNIFNIYRLPFLTLSGSS